MDVKEFLERSATGGMDLEKFISDSVAKSEEIQKRFSPFVTINRKPKLESKSGRMLGLPVSVKDCICTAGIQSTAGSRILEGYTPDFDATVIERIKKEGAFVLGKTVEDEFGFGTFSTNSGYSVPKNPHDPERSCGGSSGGAGCITAAADFPHVAIAESTGGSITAPAAFTGVIGLTPTYGRVSRWGLIDYANSLDKIGLMGRKAFEIALALSVISGHDKMESTSSDLPPVNYRTGKPSVKGLKIGIPKEYFGEGVDDKISKLVWKRIKELEGEGATCEEISMPLTKYAIPSYYIMAVCEASTNLAKYCGLRYGASGELNGNFEKYFATVRSAKFGKEVKRRIMLGTYARMAGFRDAYYLKSLKVRTKIINEYKAAFGKYDLIATPSMPILPLKLSEIEKLTPVQNYMMDIMTVAPNLAGVPMLSMPAGMVSGLPVGIHFVAPHMQEEKLLNVAEFSEGLKWM